MAQNYLMCLRNGLTWTGLCTDNQIKAMMYHSLVQGFAPGINIHWDDVDVTIPEVCKYTFNNL